MIEIKTENRSFMNDDGKIIPLMTIFMSKNDITYNCCVSTENFEDGNIVIQTLIPAFTELTNKLFPEMHDILVKAKNKLKKLKDELQHTEQFIKQLEKQQN